jgi:hypothetical protein
LDLVAELVVAAVLFSVTSAKTSEADGEGMGVLMAKPLRTCRRISSSSPMSDKKKLSLPIWTVVAA